MSEATQPAHADTAPVVPTLGLLASASDDASLCTAAIAQCGGKVWHIRAADGLPPEHVLRLVDALVICDTARRSDADAPALFSLIRAALDHDMPMYAVGDGMLALNTALGGKPPKPTPTHASSPTNNADASVRHQIYIAPGSKLAAIVGSGGFVRVNSRHAHGIGEAQKSLWLIASAYALDDGIIEALESPSHRWVVGVQFQPQRRMELPPHFHRLFQSLVERAAERIHAHA